MARALQYLRTSGYSAFAKSEPTELLIATIDKLFDILNSRSICSSGYKKAININNAHYTLDFLRQTRGLLLSLTDSQDKPLHQSRRRTCIIGLCATIHSVIYMTEKLVLNDCAVNDVNLKHLLTHRLSQDHVEMFFSIIRRRGGWNNNPTALQFRYTYRAILSHLQVVPSDHANISVLGNDDEVQALMPASDGDTEVAECVFEENAVNDSVSLPMLSAYVDNVCAYIAGFVVRRVMSRLKCDSCRELLVALPNKTAELSLHFAIVVVW